MRNLAGQLDRRIMLQAPAQGKQTNGQAAKGFEPYWYGFGGKKDETINAENQSGKQIVATGRTIWTLRYKTGVRANHQLVDRSDLENPVTYNIEGVKEIGRREAIEVVCKQVNL